MVKEYNADVENGVKSAVRALENLIYEHKVKDPEIEALLVLLAHQIERAQNGEIDNVDQFVPA